MQTPVDELSVLTFTPNVIFTYKMIKTLSTSKINKELSGTVIRILSNNRMRWGTNSDFQLEHCI